MMEEIAGYGKETPHKYPKGYENLAQKWPGENSTNGVYVNCDHFIFCFGCYFCNFVQVFWIKTICDLVGRRKRDDARDKTC